MNVRPQVSYNAQMVRVHSLLLRNTKKRGYLLSGRQKGEVLNEVRQNRLLTTVPLET